MKGNSNVPHHISCSAEQLKHDYVSCLSPLAVEDHLSYSPKKCLVQVVRKKTFRAALEVKKMDCEGQSRTVKDLTLMSVVCLVGGAMRANYMPLIKLVGLKANRIVGQ